MSATLFIDGEWVSALGGGTRDIRCPVDGSFVATVAEGGEADTEAMIASARSAFDRGDWRELPAPQRRRLFAARGREAT